MPTLLEFLSKGYSPARLPELLKDVAEGEVKDQIGRELGKYDRKIGSVVAENFARGLSKAIDAVYDMKDVPLGKKNELARQLAVNGALQLAKAAEELILYPQYAQAVAQARESDDATQLDKAKEKRKGAQDSIRLAFVNVGRSLRGFL